MWVSCVCDMGGGDSCLMCVRVYVGVGDQVETHPAFYLMVPGRWVFLRYRTTQVNSVQGFGWRKMQVQRPGHVSETAWGTSTDPNMDGWWCAGPPNMCALKFLLRIRILEIHPVIDFM